MRKVTFAVLALVIATVGVSCEDETEGPAQFVEITGTLYARFNPSGPGCQVAFPNKPPASCYSEPIAGALISTSIDSKTTTTDSQGRFDLITATSPNSFPTCRAYTLTITVAGQAYVSHRVGYPTTKGTGLYQAVYTLDPVNDTGTC
ncbi:MAG TPA: hypothetical protein VM100_01160 [Longimicrobiales bacterium]|nr:hypothetical protein [Longimicrobiales bacterium]